MQCLLMQCCTLSQLTIAYMIQRILNTALGNAQQTTHITFMNILSISISEIFGQGWAVSTLVHGKSHMRSEAGALNNKPDASDTNIDCDDCDSRPRNGAASSDTN